MLKVKHYDFPKSINREVEEWQNDIKNTIKSFYLDKKKDNEFIQKYESAFQTKKNEYAIIYKRNGELENEVKDLKNEIQQLKSQTQQNQFYQNQNQFMRNKRPLPLSRFDYEDDNDNENIQYIVKKKKKNPQRIIYEEESEKEEGEMNIDTKKEDEIEIKKLKKNKKGISKSIKM